MPPRTLAAFIERILARAREEEPAQPRWKVGWLLGMVGSDVEVLQADGKHRRCGTWRHSPYAEKDLNKEELEIQYTSFEVCPHFELQDLNELKDDQLYAVDLQVVQAIPTRWQSRV